MTERQGQHHIDGMKHAAHLLAAVALTGLFAACSQSPSAPTPTSAPSTVPAVAGEYTWTIRPAATCTFGSDPDRVVVRYATAVPLTQDGNAISMSLTTMFNGMSLSGTVGSNGSVAFSIAARGADPMQETTLSGIGTGIVTTNELSGTFDGDFRYTPKSLPQVTYSCHATNHPIELIRR